MLIISLIQKFVKYYSKKITVVLFTHILHLFSAQNTLENLINSFVSFTPAIIKAEVMTGR